MRLIDVDALIEKCGEWYTEEGTEEGFIGTVKQLLELQPEAVTRCKDCIHDNDCAIQDIAQTGFNFFCGCAERRTDE